MTLYMEMRNRNEESDDGIVGNLSVFVDDYKKHGWIKHNHNCYPDWVYDFDETIDKNFRDVQNVRRNRNER